MSYFSSSLARQGKYGRRPKVEIPEKTESAYFSLVSPAQSMIGKSSFLPACRHHQAECCTTETCVAPRWGSDPGRGHHGQEYNWHMPVMRGS